MFQGRIIAQGTFQELAESNLDIKQFLHIEEETEAPESKKTKLKELDRRTSVISNVVRNCIHNSVIIMIMLCVVLFRALFPKKIT